MADRLVRAIKDLLEGAGSAFMKVGTPIADSAIGAATGETMNADDLSQLIADRIYGDKDIPLEKTDVATEDKETFAAGGEGANLSPDNQRVAKTADSETFASAATKDISEDENAIMSAYTGSDGVPLTREQLSAMTRNERKKILEDLTGKNLSTYGTAEMFQMENDYLAKVKDLYDKRNF